MQRMFRRAATLSCIALFSMNLAALAADGQTKARFDLSPQPLAKALNAFALQAGLNIYFDPPTVAGLQSPALNAELTAGDALERLLAGTRLRAVYLNEKTVRVVGEGVSKGLVEEKGGEAPVRVAQAQRVGEKVPVDREARGEEDGDEESVEPSFSGEGIPEILVTGSKVLNTDIRRTEDDIQPYVVFDRERIERSGATNLEEFFKNQLTASASTLTAAQAEQGGTRSAINLRGLGTDETLILIDGRRLAGLNYEGTPQQSGINGIPLAAVERIEVLPTTTSGIFGGGATGGAINIVLRRDYAGFETQLTYGNTLKSDATNRRVDLSGGFNLEGGKTNVLLSASYTDSNPLLVNERNFAQRGRQHILDVNGGNLEALNEFGFLPPLGATTNIRSLGGNLVLDPEFGGTDLGSPITHVPAEYPGIGAAADGGAALVANAGHYNINLASTAQQSGGQYGLVSGGEVKSLIVALRREFTRRVNAFLELQGFDSSTEYSANFADPFAIIPASAPNNPFQQDIVVKVPTIGMDEALVSESQDRRAVIGVIAQLARDWQFATDFTWSRSRFSYAWPRGLSSVSVDAVNNGSLDVLRDLNRYPVAWEGNAANSQSPGDMVLKNTAIRLAGPLPWSLPGGNPTLSFLIEHRDELLDDVIRSCSECGGSTLFPARSQSVNSAYLESRFPFVSTRNRRAALELLELQIAIRGDDYRVTGATFVNLSAPTTVERFTNRNSSVDPTVGLRYQLIPDLTFRASYGTGYLPPSITRIVPNPPIPLNMGFFGLVDPLRGDEPIGIVELIEGGNPNLQPEESVSESIGVVFMPRTVEGLRIAADWNRIKKTGNIQTPFGFDQAGLETIINHFSERIMRDEPSDGFSVGSITGIDNTLINIAQLTVKALDLAIDYHVKTERAGTFALSADATRLFSRETQAVPDAQVIENVGVMVNLGDGALKWRANGTVDWTYGALNFGWRTRFFDSYFFNRAHTVNLTQGAASVPSQLYHDFYAGYRFGSNFASVFNVLADTELRFGVNNVFNKEPPIDVVRAGTVMYSVLGDPRLANYYVTLRKAFGQ